jgi:hypothetical protein
MAANENKDPFSFADLSGKKSVTNNQEDKSLELKTQELMPTILNRLRRNRQRSFIKITQTVC